MKTQVFHESIHYQLVITTPPNVEQADVERQLASGKWKFDIDLAFDVSGTVETVEHPILIPGGPHERTFRCVVLLDLDLRPWDPDTEHTSETLHFFSASVDLPDGWEIIETNRN